MTNNTGKFVLAALNEIAATPSKNEKKNLIRAAGASELFMRSVTFCYDPFKNFGRRNLTPVETGGAMDLSTPVVWEVLNDLISRRLSGDEATLAVDRLMQYIDPDSAEVLRRIINKDMRAGFSEGTINEVFKGTFKEFPYMRCTLPEKSNMPSWDWSVGIFSQLKADGSFANVNHDEKGQIWITTRQGTMYPYGALDIEADVRLFLKAGTQTHGELTVLRNGVLLERQVGNGILNSLAQGGVLDAGDRVVFDAWDQIPLEAVVSKGSYNLMYALRYNRLEEQLRGADQLQLVETRVVYSKAEAYDHYREKLAEGLEGTVCKAPGMGWKDTGSSGNKDQVKLKLQADVELRITGFKEGTPGTKTADTFGSLLCHSEDRTLEVGVSGLTDELRAKIHNNRDYWLDQIITVRGNGIMTPDKDHDTHSIFLPRFIEHRHDKTSADTLEQIRDQFKAAMEAV